MNNSVAQLNPYTSNIHRYTTMIAGCMIIIACCILRLSTSAGGILIPAACLILLAYNFQSVLKNIQTNMVALLCTILFIIVLVGVLYSKADWHLRLASLKHYRVLLFVPILMTLYQLNDNWKKYTLNALCLGGFFYLLLCATYHFNIFNIRSALPLKHPPTSDMYIYGRGCYLLVISIYIAAQFSVSKGMQRTKRFAYAAIAAIMTAIMLTASTVRTDYVLLFVMFTVFAIQHIKFKWLLISLPLLFLSFFGIYKVSPNVKHGLDRIDHEVNLYQEGNPVTSSGLRLLFVHNSIKLWQKKPIIGHGTGSFIPTYLPLHSYNAMGGIATKSHPLDQPHNQYAYFMVEQGVMGLFAFIALLVTGLAYSLKLKKPYRSLAQVAIITTTIHSFFISSLFYYIHSHTVAILLALCFSSLKEDEY